MGNTKLPPKEGATRCQSWTHGIITRGTINSKLGLIKYTKNVINTYFFRTRGGKSSRIPHHFIFYSEKVSTSYAYA